MDQQLRLLTGAYALNALEPNERGEFENAVGGHDEALHEVRSLSETAALLAEPTTPVAPPAQVKANIMAAIRQTPQLSAEESTVASGSTGRTDAVHAAPATTLDLGRERTRRAERVRRTPGATRFVAAAAAAFLLAAGVLTGVVVNQNQQQEQLQQKLAAMDSHQQRMQQLFSASDMKSATQTMDDGARVTVAYSASAGLAALTAHDLPSLPSDQGYELWLIDEKGATPMGMIDGKGTAMIEGSVASATHLGITVEPAQGSKKPTTTPIMMQHL